MTSTNIVARRGRKSKRLKRPMLHTENGTIKFRTRLMRTLSVAVRFARCLSNNSRFSDVEIVKPTQSIGDAWFITFLPTNEDRKSALFTRLQKDRIDRAVKEMAGYAWTALNTRYDRCTSRSGSVYVVSNDSCNCTDFVYSCSALGLVCKHIIAFNMRSAEREAIVGDAEQAVVSVAVDNPFAGVEYDAETGEILP